MADRKDSMTHLPEPLSGVAPEGLRYQGLTLHVSNVARVSILPLEWSIKVHFMHSVPVVVCTPHSSSFLWQTSLKTQEPYGRA